jgi:hypothetical protein
VDVKTYGELRLDAGEWKLTAQPHVMMRIKRVFPRIRTTAAGEIAIRDTAEVARDIEWMLTRWPLHLDDHATDYLRKQADWHRASERAVQDILAGKPREGDWIEPARPARPYQQQAADIVLATGRLLLTDEVGLGKSFSGLLTLRDPSALPALVVTLTHLPKQWLGELTKAFPWLIGHALTNGVVYDPKDRCHGHTPDVIITSYSKLWKWQHHLAGQVRTVIFDEIQELRRDDSSRYNAARFIASKANYRVGLTATPVYNYAGEIHNVVNVLAPDALGTREEFIREWSGSLTGFSGNVTVGDATGLGAYLRDQGLMLRRTRKDVGREIPEPVVVEQPIATDHQTVDDAVRDTADIARLILSTDADHKDRWKAAGDLDWKMRHATGVAKARYVADFVRLLLESEERVVLYGWHRDCFAPGTGVLMYDGTAKNVEDVRVGELVMGPDSRPRTVKSLVRGAGNLYRVLPNKGEPWVCSENHILSVRNSLGGYEKLTAQQFARRSPRWQRDRTLYRSEAVTFGGSRDVIEPWLVGYWIGDGSASLKDLRVSSSDPEVATEIHQIALRHGLSVSTYKSLGMHGTSSTQQLAFSSGFRGPKNRNRLVAHFRSLGLDGNKRIPQSYATASIQDRRQLLAGLIDSDGHVYSGNSVGSASYTTIDRELADEVAFVARSLGLAAYVKTKRTTGGLSRSDIHYSVSISGDLTLIPTRIGRKQASARAGQKNVLRSGFQIESAGVGEFYGFEVDEDHLFLLADFTVVHNCYDIWKQRLHEFNPVMYTGSESANAKEAAVDRFLNGDARVLLLSLRSGAGLDGLQEKCSVAVFGELDWSPGIHEQCVGRLWRDGQDGTVVAYYLVSDAGTDPLMTEVLGLKSQEANALRGDEQLFNSTASSTDRVRRLAAAVLGIEAAS